MSALFNLFLLLALSLAAGLGASASPSEAPCAQALLAPANQAIEELAQLRAQVDATAGDQLFEIYFARKFQALVDRRGPGLDSTARRALEQTLSLHIRERAEEVRAERSRAATRTRTQRRKVRASERALHPWQTLHSAIKNPDGAIRQSVISPDGERIVTLGQKNVRIWDTATGQLLHTLPERTYDYESRIAISQDGRRLLTTEEFSAQIWDLSTGELLYETQITDPQQQGRTFWGPQISADGESALLLTNYGRALLWRPTEGNEVRELGILQAKATRFSQDAQKILFGTNGTTGVLLDLAHPRKELTLPHKSWVNFVEFSTDERMVVTASTDAHARLWDAKSGALLQDFPHPEERYLLQASFNPNGKTLLTLSNVSAAPIHPHSMKVHVWDIATGRQLFEISGNVGRHPHSATFSPNGKWILITHDGQPPAVWDAATGELVQHLAGLRDDADFSSFSADGRYLMTVEGSQILVWNRR